jgi:hypothetical protein
MAEPIHKTISKGRKAIVFGMPWYTVDEEESPRKAGVSLAKEIPQPFDLVVTRKGATPQFALASASHGARSGAVSAASIVTQIVQADSWIYVLEIDTSVWICCGRDGYVLPHGDQVFEREGEARRAFQELNPSSFKNVYLPASWKTEAAGGQSDSNIASDTGETDILELVEYDAPKWGKLASISPLSLILQVASFLVLLGTVGAVASYIMMDNGPQNTGPTPAQIEAAQERLARQQRQQRDEIYAALDADRPWHDLPRATTVFDKCMEGIRAFPTKPVGYRMENIVCDDRVIDASVNRASGYSSWLTEWAESFDDIEASPSSNGDSGFLTRNLPSSPVRGQQDLAPFNEIADMILHYGQVEGASVDITTPAAAVVPNEPEYTPYYAVSEYRIQTTRPGPWRDIFMENPGLSVGQITYSLENKTYTMEGELYVPNL